MKDEIKEILDNLKEWSVDGNLYFEINDEKAKLLYKFITDLQEDYDTAMKLVDKGVENSYKKLKEQQKEIERLNNIINRLDKLIEQYSNNEYYYKYNGKYLKSEIINDLKELKEGK